MFRLLRPSKQTLTGLRNEGIVDGYHRLTVQENSIRHSLKRDETILIEGGFKGHTSDSVSYTHLTLPTTPYV